MSLLEVQNLKVRYHVRDGANAPGHNIVRAVDGVSFDLNAGETLGLVGESGCGKSTLGRALAGLIKPASGTIHFDGMDLTASAGGRTRAQCKSIQMIFQDPYGSLNPRMTVENIVGEGLDIHRLTPGKENRHARIAELLHNVGLGEEHMPRHPHEFSGGQRQRIGIARALAVAPRLLICDEPVSALDVSVQAQIINLLQDLNEKLGLACLFIAHDLAVVEHLCHRVLVMYLGKIMEMAGAKTLVAQPLHPYTQALISAIPVLDPETQRKRIVLQGDVPSPLNPPAGCPFHPRCPMAVDRCRVERPALRQYSPNHQVACHLAG
jgi:oligopeptide/dipeptide ABC transporter ATP-binding protein